MAGLSPAVPVNFKKEDYQPLIGRVLVTVLAAIPNH
jgi:hypothetical protein